MSYVNSLLLILPSYLINSARKAVVKQTARWSDMPSFIKLETEEEWNLLVHRVCMCVGSE